MTANSLFPPSNRTNCHCFLCQRQRRLAGIQARLGAEDVQFLEAMASALLEAEEHLWALQRAIKQKKCAELEAEIKRLREKP